MTVWDTSCTDWRERIVAGRSLIPELPLYDERAAKALRIFKRLRLVKVRGEPTMAQACAPWVFDWVSAIFGAFDPVKQRQIIRESFVLIAKKNGKSSIAAGVMLTALIMNEIRRAEYTILAPTKDIADNSFEPASGMIEADSELRKRFKVAPTTREIINRIDGSSLSVKAADADVIGGQNSISTLVDEVWLLGKRSSSENMLSEATGTLVAQPTGFILFMSTQSDDQPAGVFRKKLTYYRDVRDGKVVDPSALPVIYEFPESMAKDSRLGANDGGWRQPRNWYIPNPSLDRSVDLAWLEAEFVKKQIEGADSLRLFAAKHLNIEVGVSIRVDRWEGAEYWEDAAEPELCGDLDTLLGQCEVVVIGIDGGGLDDLLGLAVLGRERNSHRWLLWVHAWVNQKVLELRKSEAARLADLAAAEDLDITEVIGDDIIGVAEIVTRVVATGLLPDKNAIGIDPLAIGQIVDALNEIEGLAEAQIVGISQGYKLAGAIKTAARKLADGSLVHGGQAIMDWAVGNARLELKGNAVLITKQASGTAKIDPLMATLDAVALMSMAPATRRSAYETRDLLVL